MVDGCWASKLHPKPEESAWNHGTVESLSNEPAERVESQHAADPGPDETKKIADQMPRHAPDSHERTDFDVSALPDHNPLAS